MKGLLVAEHSRTGFSAVARNRLLHPVPGIQQRLHFSAEYLLRGTAGGGCPHISPTLRASRKIARCLA